MSRQCRPRARKRNIQPPPQREGSVLDFLRSIKVVSDDEAEQADFVICCTNDSPRYFDDDIDTVCARCGVGIHHRPHAPKRPKKICLECAARNAEEEKNARS